MSSETIEIKMTAVSAKRAMMMATKANAQEAVNSIKTRAHLEDSAKHLRNLCQHLLRLPRQC